MEDNEKILKALANRRRLVILKLLKSKKPRTVGELSKYLDLSFKSTSKHLAVLYGAGVVGKEQKNLSMFYFVANSLPKLAKRIINFL